MDINATIDEILYVNGKLCLNVTYDDVAYNVISAFNYPIGRFRYEGLPLMDRGAKIKVYTNKYGSIKAESGEDLTGEMAEITDRIQTIEEQQDWVYQARLLKNQRIVWVERDEAMPYDTRAAVRNDDKDESHAEREAKRDALREAGVDPQVAAAVKQELQRLKDGLYYLDEDGKLRKVDDQADITAAAWKECCVCIKKKSLVACVPCWHRIMCQQCYEKWKKKNPICPVCKFPIKTVVKVLGNPYMVKI